MLEMLIIILGSASLGVMGIGLTTIVEVPLDLGGVRVYLALHQHPQGPPHLSFVPPI